MRMITTGARELAAAVRAGTVSAADLVRDTLAWIDRVNPTVNAITQRAEDAVGEAEALDARRARGADVGPLAGVPFTVKESIAVGGLATTHGARFLARNVAARDAPPVERLRRAGAVFVGHTNMPTLTMAGMHSRSELFGSTANPWRPDRTPGGSSGGDAAAVASGMAVLGLGNDAGGSLRLPANFCGVAALKPTPGRYPADHRIGSDEPSLASQLFPVDGPIARTVDDLALVHEVLCGPDPRDPRALPVPARLGDSPPQPVALVRDPGGVGTSAAVSAALDHAADALAAAGHEVTEVEALPGLDEALSAYGVLVNTEFGLIWDRIATVLSEEDRSYQRLAMDRRPPAALPEYIAATASLMAVRKALARFGEQFPLVLGPVYDRLAPPPDLERADAEANERYGRAMALNVATTFAGLPAVAVPTGLDGGLPAGVQIIGRAYREDNCLAAAAVVEASRAPLVPPPVDA
ncbi:Indoleacetamide hydrolase [Actinokineospora spheciospongiae]|uniref:Indoleacetamide hydrolase n=2 Tax=Actinokineospora spheciospongiae TaxID=909613 RepID=W7J6V8_9PSEU|nr:Indoleacetamide hydrolase [Actinokineospora spheciospongiae]